MAVAHLGTDEADATLPQGALETVVGHQRAHHRPLQPAAVLPVAGEDVEQVVTVDDAPVRGDEHHPVAVAVERDAQVRADRRNVLHQRAGVGAAHALVDVQPVRIGTNGVHPRTQFTQHQRAHLVGGAVGAVHGHVHAVEIEAARQRVLAGLQVPAHRIAGAHGLAQPLGLDRAEWLFKRGFNSQLGGVIQLLTLMGEELDAVVVVRIVRCRNDDAAIGTQRAREVGHCRSRHGAHQLHVHPGRHQPGFKRRFEHVVGNAGVLADHHQRLAGAFPALPQRMAVGIAQAQHEIR